jgi:hypothetical protein
MIANSCGNIYNWAVDNTWDTLDLVKNIALTEWNLIKKAPINTMAALALIIASFVTPFFCKFNQLAKISCLIVGVFLSFIKIIVSSHACLDSHKDYIKNNPIEKFRNQKIFLSLLPTEDHDKAFTLLPELSLTKKHPLVVAKVSNIFEISDAIKNVRKRGNTIAGLLIGGHGWKGEVITLGKINQTLLEKVKQQNTLFFNNRAVLMEMGPLCRELYATSTLPFRIQEIKNRLKEIEKENSNLITALKDVDRENDITKLTTYELNKNNIHQLEPCLQELDRDAFICLKACEAAAGKENIAQQVAKIAGGRTVFASSDVAALILVKFNHRTLKVKFQSLRWINQPASMITEICKFGLVMLSKIPFIGPPLFTYDITRTYQIPLQNSN